MLVNLQQVVIVVIYVFIYLLHVTPTFLYDPPKLKGFNPLKTNM
jgi:hypothetical protein